LFSIKSASALSRIVLDKVNVANNKKNIETATNARSRPTPFKFQTAAADNRNASPKDVVQKMNMFE